MPRNKAGPRLREIAAAAGVSVSTVSRALAGHGNVSPALRARILAAAARCGYPVAARSGPQRLDQVAFVVREALCPAPANPFYSHVLAGAEAECRRLGLRLFYTSVAAGVAGAEALAQLARPGTGILLVGHLEVDLAALRERCPVPLVVVDNHLPDLPADSVLAANRDGLALAVQHLYRSGHRQIGFVGLCRHYTIVQRYRGFREALWDLGLALVPEWVVECEGLNPDAGYAALGRLLAQGGSRPTAVCCANDAVAMGVLRAAAEAGLAVPGDLAVVGFDDVDMAAHLIPPLTTVRVPKQAMGALAVRRLAERAACPDLPVTRSLLNVELVVRDSG